MFPEKKKAVSAIMSKFNGGQFKDAKEASDMPPRLAALTAHAEDMIGAFHNKSAEKLTQAMNNFLNEHQLHADKESDETSDYKPNKD